MQKTPIASAKKGTNVVMFEGNFYKFNVQKLEFSEIDMAIKRIRILYAIKLRMRRDQLLSINKCIYRDFINIEEKVVSDRLEMINQIEDEYQKPIRDIVENLRDTVGWGFNFFYSDRVQGVEQLICIPYERIAIAYCAKKHGASRKTIFSLLNIQHGR